MANVLSQSYAAGTQQGAAAPLFDPRWEIDSRRRFWRVDIPELRLANSLYLSGGCAPARGWVLVRRSDLGKLNRWSKNLHLQLFDGANAVLDIGYLSIVQAQCVSTGPIVGDPDSIMLVELTDRRGILHNQWVQFPTKSGYNVRAPAYPQQYHYFSLVGGLVPWTWDEMVGDLWTQMGDFLGAYPGLPSMPDSTPESWWFPGCSCWLALCKVLDHLGMSVAVDLTAASGPYTIVKGGGDDAAFAALTARRKPEDDMAYVDVGAARVPGFVTVYFHRRNEFYGTEETVRRDNLQWSTSPLYAVTVPAPGEFTGAIGTHYVWSDFTVRFDVNGAPLGGDAGTAASIATAERDQYFNRIYRGTLGFMHRVYPGAVAFATGSQVDGVLWRQDFRDRDRMSWITEIQRGRDDGWPGQALPGSPHAR